MSRVSLQLPLALCILFVCGLSIEHHDDLASEVVPEEQSTSPEPSHEALVQTTAQTLCNGKCLYKIKVNEITGEQTTKAQPTPRERLSFDMSLQLTADSSDSNVYLVGATNFEEKANENANFKENENSKENAEILETQVRQFNQCMQRLAVVVNQHKANGKLSTQASDSGKTTGASDEDCAKHAKRIYNLMVGALDTIAILAAAGKNGVAIGDTSANLLQYTERAVGASGPRVSHYTREQHDDGSATLRYSHHYELAQARTSSPAGTGPEAVVMTGHGEAKLTPEGLVSTASESLVALTGEDSESAVCTKCTEDELPAEVKEPHKVRLEAKTKFEAELVSSDLLIQEQDRAWHAKLGAAVPIENALFVEVDDHEEGSGVDAKAGLPVLMRFLENAPDSEFKQAGTIQKLFKAMESSSTRRAVVTSLMEDQLKNHRAVQALMNAIGHAGVKHPQAFHQLIALASNSKLSTRARSQALVALIQPSCYEHKPVIEALDQLAHEQTEFGTMALQVQYGLIGHCDHCTHGEYAQAEPYRALLQTAREQLSESVASNNPKKAAVWMNAIANSYSQHHADTAALIAVSEHSKATTDSVVESIHALGRLYTAPAKSHLMVLATTHQSPQIRDEADRALAGAHLAAEDRRKPAPAEVASLVQKKTTGGELTVQKSWQFPPGGDFHVTPQLGITVGSATETDGGEVETKTCMTGFGVVDSQVWKFKVNLARAEVKKCMGDKIETSLYVGGIKLYPKPGSFSFGDDEEGQASLEGPDEKGKCKVDVDDALILLKIEHDRVFFEAETLKVFFGIPMSGVVRITGQLGLKAGYEPIEGIQGGNADICNGGSMAFFVPYVAGTLTVELSVDMLLVRGGVGAELVLFQGDVPATSESLSGAQSGAKCSGVGFSIEGMGGRVYGFLERIQSLKIEIKSSSWWKFWDWKVVRTWVRLIDEDIYKWDAPASYSIEIKCNPQKLSVAPVYGPLASAEQSGDWLFGDRTRGGTSSTAAAFVFNRIGFGPGLVVMGNSDLKSHHTFFHRAGPNWRHQKGVGDNLMKLGNWLVGMRDPKHFVISHMHGNLCQFLVRSDGHVWAGPHRGGAAGPEWRHTKPSKDVKRIGDWLIGPKDDNHFVISWMKGDDKVPLLIHKTGGVHLDHLSHQATFQMSLLPVHVEQPASKAIAPAQQFGQWLMGDKTPGGAEGAFVFNRIGSVAALRIKGNSYLYAAHTHFGRAPSNWRHAGETATNIRLGNWLVGARDANHFVISHIHTRVCQFLVRSDGHQWVGRKAGGHAPFAWRHARPSAHVRQLGDWLVGPRDDNHFVISWTKGYKPGLLIHKHHGVYYDQSPATPASTVMSLHLEDTKSP